MEQNPLDTVDLVKGQPDWHLTVNDNFNYLKNRITSVQSEVTREEFNTLSSVVESQEQQIDELETSVGNQNTILLDHIGLISTLGTRLTVAEPKITAAQTTATNAATAAAAADTKAGSAQVAAAAADSKAASAQTTAGTANTVASAAQTAANTATTNITTIQNINKAMYRSGFNSTSNKVYYESTGVNTKTGSTIAYNTNSIQIPMEVSNANGNGFYAGTVVVMLALTRLANLCFLYVYGYMDSLRITHTNVNSADISLFSIPLTSKQRQYFGSTDSNGSYFTGLNEYSNGLFRVAIYVDSIVVRINANVLSGYLTANNVWTPPSSEASVFSYAPAYMITGFNGTTPVFTQRAAASVTLVTP